MKTVSDQVSKNIFLRSPRSIAQGSPTRIDQKFPAFVMPEIRDESFTVHRESNRYWEDLWAPIMATRRQSYRRPKMVSILLRCL